MNPTVNPHGRSSCDPIIPEFDFCEATPHAQEIVQRADIAARGGEPSDGILQKRGIAKQHSPAPVRLREAPIPFRALKEVSG
jgi:hypothetical protein